MTTMTKTATKKTKERTTRFQIEFLSSLHPGESERWVPLARRDTIEQAREYAVTLSPKARRRLCKVVEVKEVIEEIPSPDKGT